MSEQTLTFRIHEAGGSREEALTISNAVIAGWTGRDIAAVEKHIVELEELGVPRPASVPVYYRVAAARLTQAARIEVSGGESSGEIEFVMVAHAGKLYVGVGSDHTDRKVETYNITVSKQMCEKPIAAELWAWDEVADHWDQVQLTSWIDGETIYQDGTVAAMRRPEELMANYATGGLADGTLMFCGTLAAIGGIRPAPRFAFALSDPVLGRSIRHEYRMIELPVAG